MDNLNNPSHEDESPIKQDWLENLHPTARPYSDHPMLYKIEPGEEMQSFINRLSEDDYAAYLILSDNELLGK